MSFIQFYPLLGQSLKYILDKVPEWHFLSTFNKGIWSKKTSNFKQGLKLANFQNGLRAYLDTILKALGRSPEDFMPQIVPKIGNFECFFFLHFSKSGKSKGDI